MLFVCPSCLENKSFLELSRWENQFTGIFDNAGDLQETAPLESERVSEPVFICNSCAYTFQKPLQIEE